MNLEIEIDPNTGDLLLNRDHEVMLEIAKLLSEDYEEFEEFFHNKPLDINGDKNYHSFCG